MKAPTWRGGQPQLQSSYNHQQMEKLTLQCPADGAPPPKFVWFKVCQAHARV